MAESLVDSFELGETVTCGFHGKPGIVVLRKKYVDSV
jgi:hypothetical protein